MSFVQPRTLHRAAVFLLLAQNILAATNSSAIPLTATGYGTFYHFSVDFGGQTLPIVADTGSADLWVLGQGWNCFFGEPALNGTPVPQQDCSLGNQSYTPSSTFHLLDSLWLGEHYGQGDIVGSVGFEDIQFGPISISQQEMSVVNATSIYGVEGASGIFGLAYPIIGQVHPSNYSASTIVEYFSDRILYPTVITRLTEMNISNFSMALERMPLNQESGFGGYLSFGDLPPVSYGRFVTVPVEIDPAVPLLLSNGTKQITYWVLTVQAVSWDNSTNITSFQAVVDSGNHLNFIPVEVAANVTAAFNPPGTLDPYTGYVIVECNAQPPASFGLQIGGYMFNINSEDMIWRNSSGTCFSSVAPATPFLGGTTPILGDAFLKNVVAVFDFVQSTMSYAPRLANSSTPNSPPTSGATTVKSQVSLVTLVVAVGVMIAALV